MDWIQRFNFVIGWSVYVSYYIFCLYFVKCYFENCLYLLGCYNVVIEVDGME